MVKAVETRIYKLHHDSQTSERIGYLASQQRLAYNTAVNILNRTPTIALRRSPRHPDGLLGQLTRWRHQDSRAQAPYIIHQAGAQQAWMANDLMRRERKARLDRLAKGSRRSSDHRQHRRTLARRSRKRGTSTLTSLTPPVRLDDSSFTITGARDIVLRTKKPVPQELDIRSYQLVEVRNDCRGGNGALSKRRYALHLQVAVEYPDPSKPEAIRYADDILGIDDGVKRQLTLSSGDVLHHDERDRITRQRDMRARAQRKRRGSRRRARLLRKARACARKTRANRRRVLIAEVRRIYEDARPKAIAVEDKSYRHLSLSARGTRESPGTGVGAKSGLNRSLRDAALSERIGVMASEARKSGIAVYAVWPQGSSQTCSACGYRHRGNRESQAAFRCLSCGYAQNADINAACILRNRAYHVVCSLVGRERDSGAPTGWRVKPSLSERLSPAKGVFEPEGGSRRQDAAGREATASGSAAQGRFAIDSELRRSKTTYVR